MFIGPELLKIFTNFTVHTRNNKPSIEAIIKLRPRKPDPRKQDTRKPDLRKSYI